MKTKASVLHVAVLLAAVVLVASLPTVARGDIEPQGFWTYVEHSAYIPSGYELYHRHETWAAIHAYAQLVSATGSVRFSYFWDPPYLRVFIMNLAPYTVYVVWRCWFYIV